jgi:hypothetical protein
VSVPGVYVTDGRRLFRVIEPLDPVTGRRAELEDCYTLRTRAYDSQELWTLQLHPVHPAAAHD